jgi:aryl-alcohol dehydrogenase-like predicted oxidoreductase
MRITGPGIWGDPPDRDAAVTILRRAVELGIDFIDTADSYGPFVSEDLIAEGLYPYKGVIIATKGGLVRTGPGEWYPVGLAKYLRQCVEMSLRRLRLERIELYQLHRIDPQVPLTCQLGELDMMRTEGKIGEIGLCEVSLAELIEARLIAPIVSVQNHYSLTDRRSQNVVDYCSREGLAFIPWSPIAGGQLAQHAAPVATIAKQVDCTPAQVALAWLLHCSPVMLPIPGTGSIEHMEENVGAAEVDLTADHFAQLSAAGKASRKRSLS